MRAAAFAPATVANVAVGFDVLGFALDGVGDRVSVTWIEGSASGRIDVETTGRDASEIPSDPRKNTAAVALKKLVELKGLSGELTVRVEKGVPLSAGLGGSAASAVGAVVAASALLETPLSSAELLDCALAGEEAASGSAHADNVAPSLFGGLQLVLPGSPPEVLGLPVPAALRAVVVYPNLRIETRDARRILKPQVALRDHVLQSARLAGFVAACHRGDLEMIGRTLVDGVIEPQRAALVPCFYDARKAALSRGALGFSFAGSGPAVFAWASSGDVARDIGRAVQGVFTAHGLSSEVWISSVASRGAHVIESP